MLSSGHVNDDIKLKIFPLWKRDCRRWICPTVSGLHYCSPSLCKGKWSKRSIYRNWRCGRQR